MPTALVTGITGQDGAFLSELLLAKGYSVHGYTRSNRIADRIAYRQTLDSARFASANSPGTTLHAFPPEDRQAWERLFAAVQPNEVYHLAADSFVPNSWTETVANVEANYTLAIRILDALRKHCPEARFLNACSREIFGHASRSHANEETPMLPITPYGVHKAASRLLTHTYREKYDLFTANAILFNHESPLRPVAFVTRKITHAAAKIAAGLATQLELGNLTARRDWGFAGDYVDCMWRMLQIDTPEDFVIGTGETHSIEDFAELAFAAVDLDWRKYVSTSPTLHRTQDAAALAADYSKAAELLLWRPQASLSHLASMMVEHDLAELQREVATRRAA